MRSKIIALFFTVVMQIRTSDGVFAGNRTDVDLWISERFSGQEKSAAIQFSNAIEGVMAVGDLTATAALEKEREKVRNAIECVMASAGEEAQEMIFNGLLDVIVDTAARQDYMARLEQQYLHTEEEIIHSSSIKCELLSTIR